MASRNSNKLAKAIADHAYAKGEYQKQNGVLAGLRSAKRRTEEKLRKVEVRLAEAEKNREEALAKLTESKIALSKITWMVDTNDIRAVVRTPKIAGLKWGEFKRELVSFLIAHKEPISTAQIMSHFAEKFDIPIETSAQKKSLLQRILRRLEEMAVKGHVQRERLTTGMRPTYWLWIGME